MRVRLGSALGLALACASAAAQDAGGKPFAPEQISKGAELFATHCSTCHGNRMAKPEWAPVDLRKFPREDHARFARRPPLLKERRPRHFRSSGATSLGRIRGMPGQTMIAASMRSIGTSM